MKNLKNWKHWNKKNLTLCATVLMLCCGIYFFNQNGAAAEEKTDTLNLSKIADTVIKTTEELNVEKEKTEVSEEEKSEQTTEITSEEAKPEEPTYQEPVVEQYIPEPSTNEVQIPSNNEENDIPTYEEPVIPEVQEPVQTNPEVYFGNIKASFACGYVDDSIINNYMGELAMLQSDKFSKIVSVTFVSGGTSFSNGALYLNANGYTPGEVASVIQ